MPNKQTELNFSVITKKTEFGVVILLLHKTFRIKRGLIFSQETAAEVA